MNDKDIDNINLEELRSRSDIALISDDIGSGEELVNQFMKYLLLSRRDRRFSDYYSVKMFGSSVADMFATMSYRFKPESPFPMNETLLISEPDLYYNKEAFDDGRINLCFVIGYSGSGKSVLTKEYEGDNVEKISMDDLVCARDHYSLKQLKDMSELLYAFFSGDGAKYYITREERDLFADHSEVFVKFIEYAFDYSKEHKDRKFILEGIWTYLFFDDPSKFDDYAVFMKGTSLIKSKFRRLLRESGNNPQESLDRLLDFGIYAGDTTLKDSNVDKWRRHFEKKKATTFKLENNKFTILAETIMEQIHSINECFVHDDAEGIREIMEHTNSNSELDITEQLIVIEECKRALADMKQTK